jgi:hypothetical protein
LIVDVVGHGFSPCTTTPHFHEKAKSSQDAGRLSLIFS